MTTMTINRRAHNNSATPLDALTLLKQDHRFIEQAFDRFERTDSSDCQGLKSAADVICAALMQHMALEETFFYPMVLGSVPGLDAFIKGGSLDHAITKDLIRQIEGMHGHEKLFRARVKVLQEHVEYHFEEEEYDLFPHVEGSKLNLVALGEIMNDQRHH